MAQENSNHLEQYWSEHISSWQQSSLTQAAYCQKHQLIVHRFGYWKRKLCEEQAVEANSTGFIQLPSINPSSFSKHEALSVRLPNEFCIEGITSDNLHLVKTLTGLLQ